MNKKKKAEIAEAIHQATAPGIEKAALARAMKMSRQTLNTRIYDGQWTEENLNDLRRLDILK